MLDLFQDASGVQVMPYNWVGRHEFEAAYINDLAPVSNIRLLGCDVSSLDHAQLRIEAVMVSPYLMYLPMTQPASSCPQVCTDAIAKNSASVIQQAQL